MTTPIVTLSSLKFKGPKLDMSGLIDFQGDAGGVLSYYLDPQPSGTPLGPFTPAIASTTFGQLALLMGSGRWKVRVVATPTVGAPVAVSSSELVVNRISARCVMPAVGGGVAPVSSVLPSACFVDAVSRDLYKTAFNTAAAGNKRDAMADFVISSMGTKQRMLITRNGVLIIVMEFSGLLRKTNDGTNITVATNTFVTGGVVANGNLATGTWAFELQGGTNYSIILRGSVGTAVSTKDIVLSENPQVGMALNPTFTLLMPRAIDGLV